MSPNTNPEVLEVDSEYFEELKLKVPCDNDNSHFAVLYCLKCEINLCSMCCEDIHCFQAFAKHEIVRLTQKPEPPINCYLHPQKEAELVCKEPNCEGMSKPICIICHQYKTHKGHKYEMIEDEYTKIRSNITKSLEEVETKTKTCDKNLDEYEKCISTYSIIDDDFMKSERDKIDKLYSNARTLALKTFDDFANNRIKKLKLLQQKYEHDRTKLENMKNLLRSYEEMWKKDVLENEKNVESLAKQAGKNIDEPSDIVPFKCYNITYPNLDMMNIKIERNSTVSCLNPKKNLEKTRAIYFVEPGVKDRGYCNLENFKEYFKCGQRFKCFINVELTKKIPSYLLKIDDGRSMLYLKEKPSDNNTVGLPQHEFICVVFCNVTREKCEEFYSLLEEQIKNKWFSRIVVILDLHVWENNQELVGRMMKTAGTDKRIEIWKNNQADIFSILFRN